MHRLALLTLFVSLSSFAADPTEAAVQAPAAAPADPTALPAFSLGEFLDAAHAEDYTRAATFLDTSALPEESRAEEGPRLARRLRFVLDRKLWVDFTPLQQMPAEDSVSIGALPLGERKVDLRLVRAETELGTRWKFDAATVGRIDRLFDQHASPWMEKLPGFFFWRTGSVLELWQWLSLFALIGAMIPVSTLFARFAIKLGARAAKLTSSAWDDELLNATRAPLRFAFIALVGAAIPRLLAFPPPAKDAIDVVARTMLIASVAWFLLRFLKAAAVQVEKHVSEKQGASTEGRIRGLRTQIAVLRHVLEVAIYLVAASVILLQFEAVRSVGVSLLASAGIAGLVIGLAAQKSISSLLAGIQLSITQPIRIGDTVIVENEWGWIEEITLTYVVVKVWDLRRLVVPITTFLEKPFQNWSKVAPDILGTVMLYTDYRVDLAAMRAELDRILEPVTGTLWDGKVKGLTVTDCSERTVTVRALVSSADAGLNWDLRCLVREKMVEFLQKQAFGVPVLRAEAKLSGPSAEALFGESPAAKNQLVEKR